MTHGAPWRRCHFAGFSFVADVYDPDPKLYGYEVQDDYCGGAGGTGPITAIGYTVPAVEDELLSGQHGMVTHPGQGAGGWDVSMAAPDPNVAGWNVRDVNDARIADRFIVGGGKWEITTIVTYAYETNASTPTWTGFNANIRDGPPDDPNSTVVTTVDSATIANVQIYRVFNGMENLDNTQRPIHSITWDIGGIVLDVGEYWFDWQVEGGDSGWANQVTLPDPQGGPDTIEPAGAGLHFWAGQWTGGGTGFDYPMEVRGIRYCPWDHTGDGVVDGADLGQLLANWGDCDDCVAGRCPWDYDTDCKVEGSDLGQLLANWGSCPGVGECGQTNSCG